jgi:2-dehydro-3-deoxyphosphogalactonate aldolase
MTAFGEWLGRCPLVAILRGIHPAEAEGVVGKVLSAGIAIVEVPLNSPEPLESIRRLAKRFGAGMLLGAGTVMTPEQVQAVAAAGGRLIVTPHAEARIVREAKRNRMLACPGFATPTEAFAMLAAGADALKLFPAEASNPAALRGLLAVLPPGTLVLPVGGIEAATLRPWRQAGAAGFGVGSALYRAGDTEEAVAAKAAALTAALRS